MSNIIPPMEVSVQVGDNIVKRDLAADLALDEDHINEWIKKQPALVAYWNMLFQKQRSIVERTKIRKQRKYAELDKKIRQSAANDGRSITNKEVEQGVFLDEEYQAIEEELLQAEETLGILKAAIEAIRNQGSALIGLSANMRAEGSIVKIKKPQNVDDLVNQYQNRRGA